MRILFVQKMAGIAGSENYYLKLLPVLHQFGVDPAFLVIEAGADQRLNDPFVDELEAAGVSVSRLCGPTLTGLGLVREIAGIVQRGSFDLVQSNLLHADVWLAATKRLFLQRMKLVSTKHGFSDSYQSLHGFDPAHLRPGPRTILTRLAAAQADRIVAISNGLAKLFTDGGLIAPDKVSVVPYGFSFADAISEVPSGGVRSGDPQIITVGRLVSVKQHDLLIRAFPTVVKRFPNAKLVIIGGGPEETRLKALAQELGLSSHIVWTGFVRNVHDYLRDSDLFVFPSRAEGFGAVTLEAWFNGLPVIAFDVPAQNEIITHGVDGLLVEPFETNEIAASMIRLIENPLLRRQLGMAGRATYEARYTLEDMVMSTIGIYRSVVGQPAEAEPHIGGGRAISASADG
jgi:glycosyltransferase involved in cell wall biosynthesis